MAIMGRLLTPEEAYRAVLGLQIPCSLMHEGSCFSTAFQRFLITFINGLRLYLPIHLLPLLFRLKALRAKPIKSITHAALGTVYSALFVSQTATTMRAMLCLCSHLRGKWDKINVLIGAILCSFSLFWEAPGRRCEISLYVLPRFLDSMWSFLKRRGLVRDVPGGQVGLFALAMGTVAYAHVNEPDVMKSYVELICKNILG
jgi:hypothetical protein